MEPERLIVTVQGKDYRFVAPTGLDTAKTKSHAPDPEAVRYFLRGRHYWNKKTARSYQEAIELFQQAIDYDALLVLQGIHGLKAIAGLALRESADRSRHH